MKFALGLMAVLGGVPDAGLAFKWDLGLPIESAVDVPAVTIVDGIPVKFRQVVVRATYDEVLRAVMINFEKGGLYVQPLDEQLKVKNHDTLTGLDAERGISYTVMAKPVDAKHVSLILGEANMAARETLKKLQRGDFAPIFPGSSEPVLSTGEGFRTMAYETNAASAEVRSFYEDQLKSAGFKKAGENAWQRGREELRVVVQASGVKTAVVVSQRVAP